jgi:protein FAM50
MSDPSTSRFVSQNKTTTERLSTNTVGLVALSDFRKRRAEVLEQQEREARDALLGTTTSTPNRSGTGTPAYASDSSEVDKLPKKKKKRTKALVSFGDDEDGEDAGERSTGSTNGLKNKPNKDATGSNECAETGQDDPATAGATRSKPKAKFAANAAVSIAPRTVTKAALRREAAEREALRKEFLEMQAAVKATEIAIPFVFYDGTNTPGGMVRVRKGDPIWVFLDKSRKVGADLGVGGEKNANARREWARISVDDLMMVRGSIIIPPVSSSI